jgi:hypothetical protein
MSSDPDTEQPKQSQESTRKKVLAGIAAVLIAALTAFVSGLAGKAADLVTAGDQTLFSYSVEEQGWECGSSTYLPADKVDVTRQQDPPTDWDAFQHQPEAAYAREDVVQVAIEGESTRKVTLTEVKFSVERQKRMPGATFAAPCGGGLTGRGIFVDVGANPVRTIASSASKEGEVHSGGIAGSPTPPIRFPWTISLSDPLLLYVVASADSCYCVWTAEIPWVSGSERGVIQIDNGGSGFVVVGEDGLPQYTLGGGGWELFRL